jgi:CheY-like chemotaxis protein
MPGRDGFELAKLIRANPRLRHLPILVVTGMNNADVRIRAVECGADDFLAKPLLPDDLVFRVGNAIKLLNLRREIAVLRGENERLRSKGWAGASRSGERLHQLLDERFSDLREALCEWAEGGESADGFSGRDPADERRGTRPPSDDAVARTSLAS